MLVLALSWFIAISNSAALILLICTVAKTRTRERA
jgi:hypothetical protein